MRARALFAAVSEAIPMKVAKDHEYEIGVGIRDLPAGSVSSDPGELIVTGQQNARDGQIGLAIYFDSNQYSLPSARSHVRMDRIGR